jgi:ABC-type glutathione transport system ATPase component
VLIAGALCTPDLLILDEPESGLDVTAALVVRHLIRILAERGKAVIYSSHVLEAVEKVCGRVIVLRRGKVVADDSVSALRALRSHGSLEDVFAELVRHEDPERTARSIADVVAAWLAACRHGADTPAAADAPLHLAAVRQRPAVAGGGRAAAPRWAWRRCLDQRLRVGDERGAVHHHAVPDAGPERGRRHRRRAPASSACR